MALKGPKHEIFESGFFTQIRRLWLGNLGTGEKIEILKVGVIILRFSPRILIKRRISMRLKIKLTLSVR